MNKTTASLVAGVAACLLAAGSAFAQSRAALVSDIDNPARGFVQLRIEAAGAGSSSIFHDIGYAVPAGKRLVIDTVSTMSTQTNNSRPTGGVRFLDGAGAGGCGNGGNAFGSAPILMLPLAYQGPNIFGDAVYGGLANVQAYVDTGRCLAVRIDLNTAVDSAVRYQISIAGHLVNYP